MEQGFAGTGEREGVDEDLRYTVSVWDNDKVTEGEGGDGCATV